ncbi:hypothetical protein BJF93_15330 [Xaviernesmea oryzae]|uniref:Uncharacterized protein n=1 Tax=Xaviernesmea oryzae TaxID=464029 RepID=A0A1Q9AY16_9HYPH|nr:hypothetical protein [Xaviernesmea oryzae]OLP60327.1 hypothetical protein BJF93_15330 [Xaviernesmea oryzae]SEK23164.1 hypothetical protein SAMN04487976_101153 [Xaviernesmea oryzae]
MHARDRQKIIIEHDAPETSSAECAREKELGEKAKLRLQELMAGGYRIDDSSRRDRIGRQTIGRL